MDSAPVLHLTRLLTSSVHRVTMTSTFGLHAYAGAHSTVHDFVTVYPSSPSVDAEGLNCQILLLLQQLQNENHEAWSGLRNEVRALRADFSEQSSTMAARIDRMEQRISDELISSDDFKEELHIETVDDIQAFFDEHDSKLQELRGMIDNLEGSKSGSFGGLQEQLGVLTATMSR
ncbi:hypothetical protein BC834DRAFT_972519 [Gloeopeniophorella convolvens]|nr:hypothetical protein BC834DRAFT_972519 [Gloeopeniophorella convolvens]